MMQRIIIIDLPRKERGTMAPVGGAPRGTLYSAKQVESEGG